MATYVVTNFPLCPMTALAITVAMCLRINAQQRTSNSKVAPKKKNSDISILFDHVQTLDMGQGDGQAT